MKKLKKIALIDFKYSGHHIEYASITIDILKKEGFKIIGIGSSDFLSHFNNLFDKRCNIEINLYPIRRQFYIFNEVVKYKFLKEVFHKAKKLNVDLIYFLYFDPFIFSLAFLFLTNRINLKNILITLHRVSFIQSRNKRILKRIKFGIEKYFLKIFTLNGSKLIVHSKEIEKKSRRIFKNKNIFYIPYPIRLNILKIVSLIKRKNELRKLFGINKNIVLVLLFGGTRYDKGADLAIKVLKYLPPSYHLMIAGKEEFFSKEYLINLAKNEGVNHRLHLFLKFIQDDQLFHFFIISNIVLIPYRKGFVGQSGPLVIAGSLGIPVVVTDELVLKESVEKYGLGFIYKSENIQDMAIKIMKIKKDRIFGIAEKFYKHHCFDTFNKKLIGILENLNNY